MLHFANIKSLINPITTCQHPHINPISTCQDPHINPISTCQHPHINPISTCEHPHISSSITRGCGLRSSHRLKPMTSHTPPHNELSTEQLPSTVYCTCVCPTERGSSFFTFWQRHGVRCKKLGFYDLLQTLAFKHCDGVVDIQTAPATNGSTDAVRRFCILSLLCRNVIISYNGQKMSTIV